MIGATKSLPLLNRYQKTDYVGAYCGLCKALGRVYSQKSRLSLNRDFVFLLECLTDGIEKRRYAEQPEYRSLNCFSVPTLEDIDVKYRYCAAVNVLAAS